MKIKTGIDIIEVNRIKENIQNYGDKFLNKVYTSKEIQYCEEKKAHKYESYAGRFAVKEATFKAVSDLLDNKFDIDWKDIEVVNDEHGRPSVHINLEELSNVCLDISISHIKEVAVASVIAYN